MNVLEYIARHEGLSLRPYKDTNGFWTIGRGHRYTADEMERDFLHDQKMGITVLWADKLLEQDINAATAECKKLFPEFFEYSENRRAALIDVMFNMGARTIRKGFPSFVAAVRRRDWQRAADELKYTDGLKKGKLTKYWMELHGDPDGTDDKKKERPEENYRMLVEG